MFCRFPVKERLFNPEMKSRHFKLDRPSLFGILVAVVVTGAILLTAAAFLTRSGKTLASSASGGDSPCDATPIQLKAILHYATSRVVPQQTLAEVRLSFDVLRELSPCNFLVFGLGHDSLMWAALNPRGTTMFLEEDPKWVKSVLQQNPFLRATHVNYNTQLSDAGDLLSVARDAPECSPDRVLLKTRSECGLVTRTVHQNREIIIRIELVTSFTKLLT